MISPSVLGETTTDPHTSHTVLTSENATFGRVLLNIKDGTDWTLKYVHVENAPIKSGITSTDGPYTALLDIKMKCFALRFVRCLPQFVVFELHIIL